MIKILIWTLAFAIAGCNVAEQTPVPESTKKSNLFDSEQEQSYFRFNQAGETLSEDYTDTVKIALSRSPDQRELEESVYIKLSGSADTDDISNLKAAGQSVSVSGNMFEAKFSPGMINLFIEFDLADDNVFEGNEQLTLSLATEFMETEQIKPYSHYFLKILDNDTAPKPAFASASSTVAEDSRKIIYLSLSHPSKEETKVLVKNTGAGNASSSDHNFTDRYVTFPAGSTDASIWIDAADDGLNELEESLELEILPSSGLEYPDAADSKHTLSIVASGANPEFEFAAATDNVAENAQVAVQLDLNTVLDRDVSIPVKISGSAHYGNDYKLSSQSFDFPAGQTSATVVLSALSDGAYEGNETVVLEVEDQSFAIAGAQAQTTVTINDVQAAPQISFPSASYLGAEGSVVHLPVMLSGPALDDVEVSFTIDGTSTASAGSDYTLAYSGSFIIPAKSVLGRFPVKILEDELYENTETLVVNITGASFVDYPGPALTVNTAQTTLRIKDERELPVLSFSTSKQSIQEDAGSANVTVQLAKAAGVDIDFSVAASGNASPGSDYGAFATDHTIPAGDASYTFSVPVSDDNIRERSEKLTLELIRPANAELGSTAYHEISIIDDDVKSQVSSVFANLASINEGEQAYFTVVLDKASGMDIEIPVVFSQQANKGEDYTITSESFFIPAGDTSARIYLNAIDDNAFDGGNELARLRLQAGDHYTLGLDDIAQTTIVDLHDKPELNFAHASDLVTALEGENLTVTVELDRPTYADLDVGILVDDNYAPACNAVCASVLSLADMEDFYDTDLRGQLSGAVATLTIPEGKTKASLTFSIEEDGRDESHTYEDNDERFKLSINSFDANMAQAGSDTETEISLRQAESGDPSVTLSRTSTSIQEGELAYFEVDLSTAAGAPINIPFTFSGSAVEGGDFEAGASQFSVPAGASSAKIAVVALNDNLYEGAAGETITINLESGAGYALSDKTSSIHLTDAQTRPKLSWSAQESSMAVAEGYSAHLSLELDTPTYKDIVVQIELDDSYNGGDCGADCANILSTPYDTDLNSHPDFTGAGIITATIPQGQKSASLSIAINDDGVDEPDDERFKLRLYEIDDTAAAYIDADDDEFEVQILENLAGDILVTATPSSSEFNEGEMAWFDIVLDEAPGSDLSVAFSFSSADPDSAVKDEDFFATASPLVIPAGSTTGRIYLYGLYDETYDGNVLEKIQLDLGDQNSLPYSLGQRYSSIKLKDAQSAAPKASWASHIVGRVGSAEYDGTHTLELELNLEYPTNEDIVYKLAVDQNYGTNCGALGCAHIIGSGQSYDTNLNSQANNGLIDLTVPKGKRSAYLSFLVHNNSSDDVAREKFKLLISQSSSSMGSIDSAKNEVETTLYENRAPGAASLATVKPSVASIAENTSTATFDVELRQSQASEQCIPFTLGSTATRGSDYTVTHAAGTCGVDELSIPAGDTSGSITVSVLEDGVYEGDKMEEILIAMTNTGGVNFTGGGASLKIEDNQAKPKLFWTGPDSLYKIFEGGTAEVRVQLERPLQEALDVTVDIEDSFGDNCAAVCANILSAAYDTDLNAHPNYANGSITLTIPAGETSAALTFNALDEAVDEADEERFRLVISGTDKPKLADIDVDDNELIVAILESTDNLVAVKPTSFTVVEGNTAYFQIELNQNAPAGGVSIPFTFTGSASNGADYTHDASPIVVAAGTSSAQIAINAIGDGSYDGSVLNESIQINLSETGGSGNYTLIQSSSLMEIKDAESPPAP